MYFVILLAAAAILGGVVVVAMGRGGEMALFDRDVPVEMTRLETPGDVATMDLPFGLIGYQVRATGEALVAAANLLARRDAEIAALRREIWRLGGDDQAVVPAPSASAVSPGSPVSPAPLVPLVPLVPSADLAEEESGGLDFGAASYAAAQSIAGQWSGGSEEEPVDQASQQDPAEQADEASQASQADQAGQQ